MNYELAKKLKSVGFKQAPAKKFWSYYYNRKTKKKESLAWIPTPNLSTPATKGIPPEYFKIPTLSELIEACGKYITLTDVGPNWRAWKGENSDCDGSTPEEAVANLWLELNKN